MTATTVKVVTLPGVKNHKQPFKMARVPTMYASSSDEKKSRTTESRHAEVVSDWNNTLPGDMKSKLSIILLDTDPYITQECLVRHWNNNYRVSPERTAGMNPEKTKRFARHLAHETGGLRPLAPEGKVRKVRTKYIAAQHTTLVHKPVMLTRKVSSGTKSTYTRV